MSISRQRIDEYADALEELVRLAQLDVRLTFDVYEPFGFAQALQEVIAAAQASSDYYGDMAAVLAAELYEEVAADEAGVTVTGKLADDTSHIAVKENIEYAAHNHLFDGSADTDGFLNFVDGVMDKSVKQPARETIIESAARDESRGVRYARIPAAGACKFCVMLGSRGWVYHSEKTAGSLGQYHRDCRCEIVPSWEKSPRVEGYDPGALYDEWKAMEEGAADGRPVSGGDTSSGFGGDTVEKLKDKGLSDRHAAAVAKIIGECPDESMRNALMWSLDDLKFDDLHYQGTAHYSPGTHGLSLDIDKVSREGEERLGDNDYQTLFHEWGHYIDAKLNDYEIEDFPTKRYVYRSGKPKSAEVLGPTVKSEAKTLVDDWVDAAIESGEIDDKSDGWRFDYNYLGALDPNERICVADIVQGATNSKYGYGHKKTYYMPSRGGNNHLAAETFAHFAELAAVNPEGYKLLQGTLPESYNAWKEIVDGIEA